MSDLSGDLREHIYRANAQHAGTAVRWVMNLEWFNEVRRLDDSRGSLYRPGLTVGAPELLLGTPIEVRDDGGPPHLEPL